jgi:sulfur-oxidizing protein SoxA
MRPVVEAGRTLWQARLGQLNLSCAQCHDDNAGQKLASATIPQAHPTGYPIYRLEWQGVGSLQRRIRGCLTGVRAEPFAYGDREYIALEAFMTQRARHADRDPRRAALRPPAQGWRIAGCALTQRA